MSLPEHKTNEPQVAPNRSVIVIIICAITWMSLLARLVTKSSSYSSPLTSRRLSNTLQRAACQHHTTAYVQQIRDVSGKCQTFCIVAPPHSHVLVIACDMILSNGRYLKRTSMREKSYKVSRGSGHTFLNYTKSYLVLHHLIACILSQNGITNAKVIGRNATL